MPDAMRGLNVTLTITRPSYTVDDVGGAVKGTPTALYSNVKARVSSARPSLEARIMGYEVDHFVQASIWPARSYGNAKEDDIVAVSGGQWDGVSFTIKGVRNGSLPTSDPRAHIDLFLERVDEGRTELP